MEAVNGLSEGDKGGPPPPSPLTGCYLLIVIGEPHSKEHKDIILQRVAKGLLSWDGSECLVDLEKELAIITEQAPEGEEARFGERLIQFASENLVTEVLIHPVVSTLAQCVRNLLSSFTRHRHIIHSGYTFAANGSWVLQDGTFSLADFSEAFQEIAVQRVIRAYENGISLDIHCSPEGDWTRLPKDPFTKSCKVRVNPNDVLTSGSPSIASFIDYISPFLIPADIETLLESSDVVGNIRFSHPTLYVFPGGQGDAALFGINGFNMLLDGGFSRKACFWDFVRHLDRLDSVLLTRLNNSNINGISSVLRRKKQNAVYPQIGHFFCNIQERKALLSPDGDKDKDPLLINLLEEGQEIVTNLRHLNLCPQICYRDSEPINLYHKVGHGTLDMYVLSPAKESKEVREFLHKWNNNDPKLFAYQRSSKEFTFPLPNLVSICALLVWQPANPEDSITRILYPGSTPQQKIFEGLDKLKHLEFIKYPVCSEKMLTSTPSIVTLKKQAKDSVLEKLIEQKPQRIISEKLKQSPKLKTENKIIENNLKNGDASDLSDKQIIPDKTVKKSDSTDSEKSASKPPKPKKSESDIVNGKIDDKAPEKPKPKPKEEPKPKIDVKKTKRGDSLQRKPKPIEKKTSPTTPKKTLETKLNGELKEAPPKSRPPPKSSPSATPAKSTKDANNRKVVESKYAVQKKEPTKTADKKPERKPISRRPKDSPPAKMPGSPMKKVNGIQKPDTLSRKGKLDKEGTTDSSTVSTPSADQDSILKKDISKLTPEELEHLKAQELADLKEEQEVVKEIEAVFRKGEKETRKDENTDLRKVKDISIEDKVEAEEYLIIEKEVVTEDSLDEKDTKEDEIQKITRDSEESEKQREPPAVEKEKEVLKEKIETEPPESDLAEEAEKREKVEEVKEKETTKTAEASKEISVTSPEEKLDVSSEKRTTDRDVDEENKEAVAAESQPEEKISGTAESGATTTAPTLPEDERIPLDEIKEDNGDQVIEEKHVKEETKEKEVPVIQLPPKTADVTALPPKVPPVVGIKLEKQTLMRDLVKTPDEVADLPVHEEVDADNYEDYQSNYKGTTPTDDQKASIKTAALEAKDTVQEAEKTVPQEKLSPEKIKSEEDNKRASVSPEEKIPHEEPMAKQIVDKAAVEEEPKKISSEKSHEDFKDVSPEKIKNEEERKDILHDADTDDKKLSEKQQAEITPTVKTDDKGKDEIRQMAETDDKKLSDEIRKKEEQDVFKSSENLEEKTAKEALFDDNKSHDNKEERAESPKTNEESKEKMLATEKEHESKAADIGDKTEIKAFKDTADEQAPCIKNVQDVLEKSQDVIVIKEVEKEPKESAEAIKTVDACELKNKEEKADVAEKDKIEKPAEEINDEPQQLKDAQKVLEKSQDVTVTKEIVEKESKEVAEAIKTAEKPSKIENKLEREEVKEESAAKPDNAVDTSAVCDKIDSSEVTIKENVDTQKISSVVEKTIIEGEKPTTVFTNKHLEERHLDVEEVTEEKEKIEPMEKEKVDLKTKEPVGEALDNHLLDEEQKVFDSVKIEEKMSATEKTEIDLQKTETLQDACKLNEKVQETTAEVASDLKLGTEKLEDSSKTQIDKNEIVKDLKTAEKEDNIVVSKTEEVKKVYSKEEHETDAKVFKPEKDSFDTEKSDAIKSEKEVAIETSDKKEAIAEKQKESVVEEIKTNKNETESKIEKPQSEEIKTEKSEDKIDSVEPEKAQSDDRSSESNKDVKNDEILVISHVEQPEHAESIVIPPSDSTPESPVSVDKLKQIDFTDKMELGRKSPKEREEDVAKIVASVAEVLKSDAPLEEFEGKLPFKTFPPFTPYTTELRETHITTVESPISEDGKIIKSVEMPTNIIETAIAEEPPCLKEETDMFLHEERKASPVFPEKGEKKITTLMRDSNELMEATSKIISEIKSGQSSTEHEVTEGAKEDKQKEEMKELEVESVKEGKPKEETKEPETDIAKEEKLKEETKEDTGVVHRMLVTASSEDGGEETVICPPGSIIFSRSSESSGRSSPDLQKTTSQRPSFDSSDVTQRKDGDKDSGKSSPDLKHHEADKEAQKGVESKDTVTPKIEENVEHKDKLSDVATEPTIQENKTDYKTGVAEDVSKPTEKSTGDKADTRKDSLVNGFNDAVVAKEPKSEPQEWQHLEKDVSKTDVPAKDICKEIKETKTDDIKKSVEHEEKTKVESVDTKISSIESAKGDVLSEPAKGKDGEQSTLSSVEDGGERELDKKSERDTDISKITLDDTKKEQKETKVTGLDSQCDFDHKHKQSDIAKDAVDKKLEESADNKHYKVQGEKDALKKDSGDTKIDKTQDEQPSKGSFAHSEKFDTKTEEAFASLQTDGSNDSDYYKDQEIEEFRRETGADSGIESFNDFGELDKEPIVLKDSEDVMLNGTFDSSPSSIETIKTSIVSEKGAKEIDSAVSAKEIKEQSLRDGQHSEIAVIDEKIDVPSNDCCATNSAKKTVSNIDRDPKDVIEKDSKDAMAECKTDKILIETAKDKDGEPQPKESVILEKRDSEIKDSVKIESIVETKEKEPCAVEDFSKIGEKQEHHSGKSTPELLNGKPELSGKSTLDGTKEKTASSVTSRKSTPDIKGEEIKCSTPDSKQISGKSSPVALSDKNVSVSGKTTPEVVSQTEILKCSTPDSNLLSDKNVSEIDNVHTSGKTTPELLKDDRSITSGKSTPEIKLESVKDHSESIANADGASLTSGISTPEIRESSKSITETEFDVLEDRDTKSDVCTVKDANIAGPSNILDKELTTSRHLSPSKTSTEELHLSGKSTPDIADVEKKESQDILGHEKHISGSSTPPTVPVSPIIKDKTETINKKSAENVTITSTKEAEQRSFTPASDEYDLGGISSAQSDVGSSGRASRAPQLLESDKNDSEEEDMPGSPLSMTSQVAHSRSSSHYDFEEDKFVKGDQMTMSFYGSLPDDPLDDKKAAADVDFEQAIREHQEARGEVLGKDAPTYLYEVTKAKYSTTDVLSEPRVSSSVQDPMTCSFIGELPTTEQAAGDDKKDPIASWGKPLGLPSPAPPTDNKGTPKKERKLPPNVSAKNKLNDDKKRSESPSKFDKKQKKMPPVYVDLTYVPHHGNSNYSYVDFFKRVRARYYVFSGIEPSKEVYNALLEAKQTWDDKDLEVTIIPTYDTDILGYWVAENEDLLAKYKIDLSPSASRCTINLQDHETSCSAYRLEF